MATYNIYKKTTLKKGRLIGNAVGGYFSDVKWEEGSFFDNFQYLMPCLVAAFIGFIALIVVICCLEETKQKKIDNNMQNKINTMVTNVNKKTNSPRKNIEMRKKHTLKSIDDASPVSKESSANSPKTDSFPSIGDERQLTDYSMHRNMGISSQNNNNLETKKNNQEDQTPSQTEGSLLVCLFFLVPCVFFLC